MAGSIEQTPSPKAEDHLFLSRSREGPGEGVFACLLRRTDLIEQALP
jgi:hypothetical protein